MYEHEHLVRRAVRGLKCCGPFYYRGGDEPNPLDCSLAGRVARVFRVGDHRARELCHSAGEDPDYQEPRPVLCDLCPNDAECRQPDGQLCCGDCCVHDEDTGCRPLPAWPCDTHQLQRVSG